jgi:hypothetical protein
VAPTRDKTTPKMHRVRVRIRVRVRVRVRMMIWVRVRDQIIGLRCKRYRKKVLGYLDLRK